MELTEKQKEAWKKPHSYDGPGYKVTIKDGVVEGYFSSKSGEGVAKFKFEYDPLKPSKRDPSWRLSTYTQYVEEPSQHGWLLVGSGDNISQTALPQFPHPNELYQHLRELFGYQKTTFQPYKP